MFRPIFALVSLTTFINCATNDNLPLIKSFHQNKSIDCQEFFNEKKDEFKTWLRLVIKTQDFCKEQLPEFIPAEKVDKIFDSLQRFDAKTKLFAFIIAIAGQFRYEIAKQQQTENASDFGDNVRILTPGTGDHHENAALLLKALDCDAAQNVALDIPEIFLSSELQVTPYSLIKKIYPTINTCLWGSLNSARVINKDLEIYSSEKILEFAQEDDITLIVNSGHYIYCEQKCTRCFVHSFVPSDINKLDVIWNLFSMFFYNCLKNNCDKESKVEKIAKFYWFFINLAPYKRGSVACAEWICKVILENINEQVVFDLNVAEEAIRYELSDFIAFMQGYICSAESSNEGSDESSESE